MEEIKNRIKQHEGFRNSIYKDSLGFKTIGYGHLITPNDNFLENYDYSKEILEEIFEKDFEIAKQSAIDLLKNIEHNDKILGVIIEMCFQLGKPRVINFKKMFLALKEKDYCKASSEMINSKWYLQTPKRCLQLAEIIKNN